MSGYFEDESKTGQPTISNHQRIQQFFQSRKLILPQIQSVTTARQDRSKSTGRQMTQRQETNASSNSKQPPVDVMQLTKHAASRHKTEGSRRQMDDSIDQTDVAAAATFRRSREARNSLQQSFNTIYPHNILSTDSDDKQNKTQVAQLENTSHDKRRSISTQVGYSTDRRRQRRKESYSGESNLNDKNTSPLQLEQHQQQQKQSQSQSDSSAIGGYKFEFVSRSISPKLRAERCSLQRIEEIFQQSRCLPKADVSNYLERNGRQFQHLTESIRRKENMDDDEKYELNSDELARGRGMMASGIIGGAVGVQKRKLLPKRMPDLDTMMNLSHEVQQKFLAFKQNVRRDLMDVEYETSIRSIQRLKNVELPPVHKRRLMREFPIQQMPRGIVMKMGFES